MKKAFSLILALLTLFAALSVCSLPGLAETLPDTREEGLVPRPGKDADTTAALDACRKCMEAMESVYVADSDGHMMYSTLKGGTVAQVIANKDKLIENGANEEDINNAEQSTKRLIKVLTPYAKLKTERERFNYYKENYEEIRSQFMRLYTALYSLYGNSMIRMELTKKGKLQRYCQFVSQLYVIAMALDDTVTFSQDWRIKGNDGENIVYYKPSDLLESVQLVPDRNCANPAKLTYPVLLGDVNSDGLVNKKDSLALKMYLADNSYKIDQLAADIYTDGIVNKKDSLRLKQHLAGWDDKPTAVIYGDVNGDGYVNKKDSLLLRKYLSDNRTVIDKKAADVYKDGNINKKDSLLLKQYLAGHNVTLGA